MLRCARVSDRAYSGACTSTTSSSPTTGPRAERNAFHDLMRYRVREVLLVASLYESFVVESDGVLTEQIYGEYFKLHLNTVPRITCAYTAESALEHVPRGPLRPRGPHRRPRFREPAGLARAMKDLWPAVPVLLMATNNASLAALDPGEAKLTERAKLAEARPGGGGPGLRVERLLEALRRHAQAGRGPAQRRRRHPHGPGARHPPHRGLGALLLALPAPALPGRAAPGPGPHRGREGRGDAQAPPIPREAEGPPRLELRGGGRAVRALRALHPHGDHRRPLSAGRDRPIPRPASPSCAWPRRGSPTSR